MKEHYCGESPFGNGPDNGCRIRTPAQPQVGSILADYRCSYTENPYTTHCEQEGQPSPDVAKVLLDELSKIGLPRGGADGQLFFTIWTSNAPDWTLAEATYSRRIGLDLASCKVTVIIDQHANAFLLRTRPFARTNVDVFEGPAWSLVDLADADGDGQIDIILEGDAYEDHWLEVASMRNGAPETIFSGLGYYL